MLRKLEVVDSLDSSKGLCELYRFIDHGWQRECLLKEEIKRVKYKVTVRVDNTESYNFVCRSLRQAREEIKRLSELPRESFESLPEYWQARTA